MKKTLLISTFAAAMATVTAIADVTPLRDGQDIPNNGTGIAGGDLNDPENNLYRLLAYFDPGVFCTPVLDGHLTPDNQTSDFSGGGLAGFDFAVLHYALLEGDESGAGSGVAAYYLDGTDAFQFPFVGNGPSAYGEFSSIDLYKCEQSVPDTGATMAFLGMSLFALGTLRRKLVNA